MSETIDQLIHAERGKLLSELPKGAQVFCSAGCSGRWYFDWIEEKYGPVQLHFGVELFSPEPQDLPPNVRWISNSVAKMVGVPTGAVDILFSGQNVEHLYLEDLEKFFHEANRVVRHKGHLCIDSPNRAVSQELGYAQPQHVLELSVQDAIDLVEASGFEVVSVRGIWSCTDGVRHHVNVTDLVGDVDARLLSARDNPLSSFIWWIVAQKTGPVTSALPGTVERIVTRSFQPFVLSRFRKLGGSVHQAEGTDVTIRLSPSDRGYIFYGPYVPLRAGDYRVSFDHKFVGDSGHIVIDAAASGGSRILAQARVAPREIGHWTQTHLQLSLHKYTEGVETRLSTEGSDAIVRFGARIARS